MTRDDSRICREVQGQLPSYVDRSLPRLRRRLVGQRCALAEVPLRVGLRSVPTVQLTEQLRIDPASFFRRGPPADLQSDADQSRSDDDVPQLHGRR